MDKELRADGKGGLTIVEKVPDGCPACRLGWKRRVAVGSADFYIHDDPDVRHGIRACEAQKGGSQLSATTGVTPPNVTIVKHETDEDHERAYYAGCECTRCFNKSRVTICRTHESSAERRKHAARCAYMARNGRLPSALFWRREMRWSMKFSQMDDNKIVMMQHANDH